MGLFDIFTGDPQIEAANAQRQNLERVASNLYTNIDTNYNTGRGDITAGTDAARGALTTGYNRATAAADPRAALGYLDTGANRALSTLGSGFDTAVGAYAPLSDLASKYGQGTSTYLDALGVNGPEAAARARQAFTPSTGYDFTLGQGLEAINRRRNAAGMLDSGNADRDAQEYVTNLASLESNRWLDRLGNLVSPELAATSGAASGVAGLRGQQATTGAGIENQLGINKANIDVGRSRMLADLASRYGTTLADLEAGAGRSLAGLADTRGARQQQTELALLDPYNRTYSEEAAAKTAGSGNLWNLGMNVAKTAVGGIGGAFGGLGGIGGGLGSTAYSDPTRLGTLY